MAETIEFFPETPNRRRGESKYAKYLDGRVWKLTDADKNGCATLQSLTAGFCSAARTRGLKARVCMPSPGVLVVQAIRQ